MNVTLRKVCYAYKQKYGDRREVLHDVTLTVNDGECVGIVGLEGSGKTTLLNIIDGLLQPDSGEVMVDGTKLWHEPSHDHSLRRSIGYVFQFPEQQFFSENVEAELTYTIRNSEHEPATAERCLEALESVGLEGRILDSSPFALSVGEARRLAVASVLVTAPKLVLFDEPTAGMDVRGREMLVRVIEKMKKKNVTMFVASHDIDFLVECVSRLIILANGRIAEDGAAHRIVTDAQKLASYGYDVPEVVSFMSARGQGSADLLSAGSMDDIWKVIRSIRTHRGC